VEGYHFDMRKHLLEYDDVLNVQRKSIYSYREKLLKGDDLKANIIDMIKAQINHHVFNFLADEHGEDWNIEALLAGISSIFPISSEMNVSNLGRMSRDEIEELLINHADSLYKQREQENGPENMRVLESLVMIRAVDSRWVEYLTALEETRHGIGLLAYAQKDPLVAYKKEAYDMFKQLEERVQHTIVGTIYHAGIVKQAPVSKERKIELDPKVPVGSKIGRNDPCPCGSGKKYKKCHGQ
jgi:preprotein translocase subunit SecA